MKTIRMISKSVHVYSQKTLRVGQAFESEPNHVKMLVATGRAEVAPPEIHTREITTEGRTLDPPVRTAPKHDGKKEK